jgi:hypothetical protein
MRTRGVSQVSPRHWISNSISLQTLLLLVKRTRVLFLKQFSSLAQNIFQACRSRFTKTKQYLHIWVSFDNKFKFNSLTKTYWLLGRSSRLSLSNKLLLYKSILKPIWTYGIQLWGTASTSNIEILERFQPKALRIIVDAPWYVPNNHIRRDLQMTYVKEEICRSSNQYCTRLTTHTNNQILTLMEISGNRRLRRHVPNHLTNRFLL